MLKAKVPGATTPMEKFLYGTGDIGAAMCFSFMSSFIPLYYTDSVGLSAAFVGLMIMVVRVLDGFTDIIIGILIDKTNTRWGKVRPWFVPAALFMAIGVFITFRVPENFGLQAKQVYAVLTYVFTAEIAFSIYSVAFAAYLPRISLDQHDRNKTAVSQRTIATVGLTILFALTPVALQQLGGEKSQSAWSSLTFIYAILCFVLVFLVFLFTKEKIGTGIMEEKKVEKISFMTSFKAVATNKYYPLLIIIFIGNFASSGILAGAATYYCRDVLGDLNIYSIATISMIAPAIIGYPFAPAIIKKFGKRRSMLIGSIASTACILVCFLNPYSAVLFVVMIVLSTLFNVPFNAAMFTLIADLVDYGAYKSGGVRAEGGASLASSFGTKIGTGLGAALIGWVLEFGKYDGQLTQQPQSALNAMIILVIGLRAAMAAIISICLAFWDVEKYSAEFAKENEELIKEA